VGKIERLIRDEKAKGGRQKGGSEISQKGLVILGREPVFLSQRDSALRNPREKSRVWKFHFFFGGLGWWAGSVRGLSLCPGVSVCNLFKTLCK